MQNISQLQTKKQRNSYVTLVGNLNVSKTDFILKSLKTSYCNKSIGDAVII